MNVLKPKFGAFEPIWAHRSDPNFFIEDYTTLQMLKKNLDNLKKYVHNTSKRRLNKK